MAKSILKNKQVRSLKMDFQGMTSTLRKEDFDSIEDFNEKMSNMIAGYGHKNHTRGNFTIKITGLKK